MKQSNKGSLTNTFKNLYDLFSFLVLRLPGGKSIGLDPPNGIILSSLIKIYYTGQVRPISQVKSDPFAAGQNLIGISWSKAKDVIFLGLKEILFSSLLIINLNYTQKKIKHEISYKISICIIY